MTTNMDDEEDVLFQDFLCKLKQPKKGRFSRLVQERWKTKFFVLCCQCDQLVLKYYNKKPKQLNSQPKNQMSLKPSFKVEKLSNAHSRAFAVELTSPTHQVCLSADEQSTLDLFVFLLQTQVRLRHTITDNLIEVTAESSESLVRIGAKGAKCILHVSPWGLTLTLRECRVVLAQWPLKSVRYYESSGQGQFTIQAGTVAPMGEGVYTFHTLPGLDNRLYDAVDHFVINTLDRVKPNQRGTEVEIADYLREFDCLHSLTVLTPSPIASIPEVIDLLQNIWNTSPQALGASKAASSEKSSSNTSSTPTLVLPQSSSSAASSVSSSSLSPTPHSPTSQLVSDNTSRPLPSPLNPRSERHRYSPRTQQRRVDSPRQQKASPSSSSSGAAAEGRVSGRPPFGLSARSAKGSPQSPRHDSVDGSASSTASEKNRPDMPLPRRHSNPASVALRVTHDADLPTAVLKQMSVDGSGDTELVEGSLSSNSPRSPPGSAGRSSCPVTSHGEEISDSEHKVEPPEEDWLVSASCEDLSDHMRAVIFHQRHSQRLAQQGTTAETSDSLSPASPGEDGKPAKDSNRDFIPPPFADIKGFSTAVELERLKSQQARDRSQSFDVNAKGHKNLHNGTGNIVISSGSPSSPSIRQIRKLVSARKVTKENLRKSLSNPNFLNLGSKEKLYQHRVQATKSTVNLHDKDESSKLSVQTKHKSRSLVSLLPSTVRRYISRESLAHPSSSSPSPVTQRRLRHHHQQHTEDDATLDSSTTPYLQHQGSQHELTVKGIRFTERSRSFRRPKDYKRSKSADPLERDRLDSADNLGELSPVEGDGNVFRSDPTTAQGNGSIDAGDHNANDGDSDSKLRARNADINGVRPLPPKPDWRMRLPNRSTSQTSC